MAKRKQSSKEAQKQAAAQPDPQEVNAVEAAESAEPAPPWIKSWNGWYALVLGNLLLMILFFYLFTKAFE